MPQLVNAEFIRDTIKEKKDIFLAEFPDLEKEINDLAKAPKCSSCVTKFFTKLFVAEGIDDKLKLIYGNDIEINKALVVDKTASMIQVTEVEHIPVNEWDNWYKKKAKVSPEYQIRSMNTFYNPTNGCVTVSYVAFIKKKK